MYYSLEVGPSLHLVVLHSESSIDTADIDARQAAWLAADLAHYTNPTKKWTVTAFHRPMYCTDSNSNDCGLFANILRNQTEDIIADAGVDLVITAHMHGYERSYPMRNGTVTRKDYNSPTAPVYVVQVRGGGSTLLVEDRSQPHPRRPSLTCSRYATATISHFLQGAGGNREGNELPRNDQPWSAPGASGAIGFAMIEIRGPAFMSYSFVRSADGTILDSFNITK